MEEDKSPVAAFATKPQSPSYDTSSSNY